MTSTPTLTPRADSGPNSLVARPVHLADIPRSCWERLLAVTPAATPFARWTFHRAWWDAYGDTAHEQYLACVPSGSGEAIDWELARAIVPLMHRHEMEPEDAATRTTVRGGEGADVGQAVAPEAKAVFFGASYHADYATILCAPADVDEVARATARALAGAPDAAHGSKDWDVVDLRRLREMDPILPALTKALSNEVPGCNVTSEQEDVCPVINAPSGDWDEYLATLDKKDRHEIRRKLRRAAVVGSLSIEISRPTREAIDSFVELHTLRFGGRGLFPPGPGGERSRRFIDRLAQLELEADDDGQLHVGLVRCGSRLVWAMLAFDDGATCFLYNAGMDPEARDVSPGITGTAAYLQNRLTAGRRRFDFLRGDEPYKYEWGARDEPITRLLVMREAPR